jgi:hypothetical protein
MSDPEKFLSRWSRRKREASHAIEAADPPDAAAPQAAQSDPAPSGDSSRTAPAAGPGVAPPTLPAIADITAETDVSGFLRAGVPEDVARAALRRAWSADPAIRDFIGLSENSWDFNAPDGMPGFGPIDPAEVERLIARFAGKPETAAAHDVVSPAPQHLEATSESGRAGHDDDQRAASGHRQVADTPHEFTQRSNMDVASQDARETGENSAALPRPAHGGALPQ